MQRRVRAEWIGHGARRRSWSGPVLAGILLIAGLAAPSPAPAQTFRSEAGPLRVVTVAEGLEHPWGLAFLPDGRMLVTERPGRLRLVETDGRLSPPLAGIPEVLAEGQGGLLDVVLDPDFADNRFVYLSYAEPDGRVAGTSVARGRLADGRLEDVTVIFQQQPKVRGALHFGSRLVFAPDGMLFVALGERYQKERAQNENELLGKVVRIAPDGSVPRDNPFVGRDRGRPEIWSIGHRNIQSAAIHPDTGRLWTVEHGARGGDEINVPEAGKNYGWPVITYGRDYSGLSIGEGTEKPGLEQPIHYWDPSFAPSGAAFYTADRFPEWRGDLFVGSLKDQLLVRVDLDGSRVVGEERLLGELEERIRDVRVGPDGSLFLLTDNYEGRVLRVDPAG